MSLFSRVQLAFFRVSLAALTALYLARYNQIKQYEILACNHRYELIVRVNPSSIPRCGLHPSCDIFDILGQEYLAGL